MGKLLIPCVYVVSEKQDSNYILLASHVAKIEHACVVLIGKKRDFPKLIFQNFFHYNNMLSDK